MNDQESPGDVLRNWPPQPGTLWSLCMKDLNSKSLIDAMQALQRQRTRIEDVAPKHDREQFVSDIDRKKLVKALEPLVDSINDVNADFAMMSASRLLTRVNHNDPALTWQDIREGLNDIDDRFRDHLERKVRMLVLSERETELFVQKAPLFGEEVDKKFGSSTEDIEEAGKCMALGRWTAAVLHLMRALEPALRALQKEVQAQIPKDQWEQMIRQIEKAIKQMDDDRHSGGKHKHTRTATKEELAWYSGAAINFRHVKGAWRNYAVHGKVMYDQARAEAIFGNVRAFMIHLAERLEEPPASPAVVHLDLDEAES